MKQISIRMKDRIRNYTTSIDQLLQNPPQSTDWKLVLESHLQQIVFFQHERLVHLIVTMTVAVLTLLSAGFALLTGLFTLLLLTGVLFLLFLCYLLHYFLLENQVQAMYVQYDRIQKHLHP